MPHVNPFLHLDHEFMWRWEQLDENGETAFLSAKSFFFREDCQQDYVRAMQHSKPS